MDYRSDDFVQDDIQIVGVPIVTLGPDVPTAGRVDELSGHLDVAVDPARAPSYNKPDAKFVAELAESGRSFLKSESRIV